MKKKKNHLWKIADMLFKGDVCINISDVNRAALIIHTRKQPNLGKAVFLGISFNITATLTF